jgi:non-specific serine/threonine protein kinase/serine/threonine-protein kinase
VEALRGDIERLLAGYPILARRGAAWYKAKKFLSRNRAPAITGALAVLGLSAALLYAWDQARTAKRRYSDTRALARTMMFDAHDAVMELPGSTPVQRLLIDRSLSYFERLAAESGGDPEVLAELAEGYGRLGELMGSPYRPNTGDSARAAETIRRGLKLVEAGTGEAAQKARARLQTTLSEVLSISDPTAALAAIRAAVAMHEQIVARFPSAGNRLELMSAYGSLGDALEGEDALTAQERSLQAARAVLAIEPQNARARRGVAIGLYKMGDASFKLHRYRQALSLAGEAILALEVSPADSVPMKRMKAAALQLTGESQRELGAPLEGIAPIKQAIAIHEGLQRRDPANQQPVISLAIMHRAQGDNWSAAGERAKARAAYRRSRELLESVMRVDPGNAVWRGRLAEIRELESRVM